ncbi:MULTISPECIES: hypothetical protein [unclassified Microcoleus]|uniref:hypothetical protein n=1 Tax=unclassified Microcoleus TaxID=2642155 RepID=UPI002FD45D89
MLNKTYAGTLYVVYLRKSCLSGGHWVQSMDGINHYQLRDRVFQSQLDRLTHNHSQRTDILRVLVHLQKSPDKL